MSIWRGPVDADRLRALREARGWTRLELAEAIGVSEQTVVTWETGGSYQIPPANINPSSMRKLAGTLGVDVDYLSGYKLVHPGIMKRLRKEAEG